jgi:hypothetical protein
MCCIYVLVNTVDVGHPWLTCQFVYSIAGQTVSRGLLIHRVLSAIPGQVQADFSAYRLSLDSHSKDSQFNSQSGLCVEFSVHKAASHTPNTKLLECEGYQDLSHTPVV